MMSLLLQTIFREQVTAFLLIIRGLFHSMGNLREASADGFLSDAPAL
jgi:hypothetical protein